MKKYLILSFLILTAGAIRVQAQDNTTPYMTKSLSGESVKSVKARTQGGSISVEAVSSDPRIEVYITSNNSRTLPKEEIQQRLTENYDLSVTVSGGQLSAIARVKTRDMNWKRALNISYRIYVPQQVSTDLATSGGSISLNGVSGTQDFETSGGSLSVDNVAGKINGGTSGGSIHVKDSKDDIDLRTSGGSIEALHCDGNIRLNTSGGSLTLRDLKGDIHAVTSGGSVDGRSIDGQLAAHTSGGNVSLYDLSCSLDASTSGGNIDVEIRELRAYVKINNSSGHVDLQLPKGKGVDLSLHAEKISSTELTNFDGSMVNSDWEGKLNGGGTPVNVDAGSGKINLTFK